MTTYRPVGDDEETPGLAGQRTDLAWNRTGLALAVSVAAVLRLVVRDLDDLHADAWVFVLLAGGALSWTVSLFHARTIAGSTLAGQRVPDATRLRNLCVGTTLFALGALVLAIVAG